MNDASSSWIQSDKAGYRDRNGRYASGNDIMHLDRIRAGFSPPMDIGWIRLATRLQRPAISAGASTG